MNEKVNKYFELLHPNREELSAEERYFAAGDRIFIFDNIDIIDRKFQKMVVESEMRGEEINEQEIIKSAIEGVKGLQTTFSVQQIGQVTINAPTTAKKEAEQVENIENTRDNIKEGEEVGDDN